jgi:hypothetical protein
VSAATRVGALPVAQFGARGMSVEIASARPAQVTLDLQPRSRRFVPMVHALYPKAPDERPLTDVKFRLSPDRTGCVLDITVPDDLEPGTYTGVVVDSTTEEPGGTLCVRVHPVR